MLYSVLGTSGMRVSKLALGTATFGVAPTEAEADRVIGAALDAGINLIDTANAYGNLAHFDRPGVAPANERASAEEIVGACLKGRRDELVISTKASEPIGPASTTAACRAVTWWSRSTEACAGWGPTMSTSFTRTTPTGTPRSKTPS